MEVLRLGRLLRVFVLVHMYEHSSGKLFVRIMRNGDVKVNVFPLFSFSFLCIVFIALFCLFVCL